MSNFRDSLPDNWWTFALSAGILCFLLGSYFFWPDAREFYDRAWEVLNSGDQQQVRDWVRGFGWLGPAVIVGSMVVQMFLIVVPSVVLIIGCILSYGPFWGSLVVFVAIFTASTIGYLIGRSLREQTVKRLIGEKSEKKVSRFIGDYGFWAVVITRVNPILSNDAISFVAGVLGMNYWKFIGSTLLGIAPLTIALALVGGLSDSFKNGLIWVSAISAVMFVAFVWWDRNRKKSGSEE